MVELFVLGAFLLVIGDLAFDPGADVSGFGISAFLVNPADLYLAGGDGFIHGVMSSLFCKLRYEAL